MLQCQWCCMVGCFLLPHAGAFNIALLDRRLGNRWQGITLSPTLNTDILGQASATHFAICLFVSPPKSPPYPRRATSRLGDIHEWNWLDSWATLAKHTLPFYDESICSRMFKWPRRLWLVGVVLGFRTTGQMTSEPDPTWTGTGRQVPSFGVWI